VGERKSTKLLIIISQKGRQSGKRVRLGEKTKKERERKVF